jgi:hypothetical protein
MHFEGFARCKLVDPSKRRVRNVGSCRGIYLSSRSLGEVAGGGYLSELIRVAGRLRWRLTAAPLTWCLLASSPTILWLLWSLQSRTRPCAGKDDERAPGVMLAAGVPQSRQSWQGFRFVITVSTQTRVRTKQIRTTVYLLSFVVYSHLSGS